MFYRVEKISIINECRLLEHDVKNIHIANQHVQLLIHTHCSVHLAHCYLSFCGKYAWNGNTFQNVIRPPYQRVTSIYTAKANYIVISSQFPC